jgi:hypothetical protein
MQFVIFFVFFFMLLNKLRLHMDGEATRCDTRTTVERVKERKYGWGGERTMWRLGSQDRVDEGVGISHFG